VGWSLLGLDQSLPINPVDEGGGDDEIALLIISGGDEDGKRSIVVDIDGRAGGHDVDMALRPVDKAGLKHGEVTFPGRISGL